MNFEYIIYMKNNNQNQLNQIANSSQEQNRKDKGSKEKSDFDPNAKYYDPLSENIFSGPGVKNMSAFSSK